MAPTSSPVGKFSTDALQAWMDNPHQEIRIGDVFPESVGTRMDVTFIRWGA